MLISIVAVLIWSSVLDVDEDRFLILDQARELLRREYAISRATIQIEAYDVHAVNACGDALPPRT